MQTNSPTFWNELYKLTPLHQFTWFEAIPVPSLKLITNLELAPHASIIDVGGGPAILARQLLAIDHSNVTIVDFSFQAIRRGKAQLGEYASNINWIQSDILSVEPGTQYDLWHDRACLHYLADKKQQNKYVETAYGKLNKGGFLIVGVMAGITPTQSAGLPVHRFTETGLSTLFADGFELISCLERTHITPRNRLVPYVYCCFKKR